MRVCVLTRIVSQHGANGGMERHLVSMGSGLRALEHDVTVLTTSHPDGRRSEEAEWGEVLYLPGTRAAAYWPGWFRASLEAFSRLHSTRPFDLVICEGAAGERYARVKSERGLPPLVSIMHGTLWGEVENHRRALSNLTAFRHALRYLPPMVHHAISWRSYVQNADLLIAVSREIGRRVLKQYRVDSKRILAVENGINTSCYRFDAKMRKDVRTRLAVEDGDVLLLTASRLIAEKGVHVAIEATNLLHRAGKQVKLVVCGDGPQKADLQRQVAHRGLTEWVMLVGHVGSTDMPGLMSAADIVLFPTLRVEGLPFVLLEAMACERPSIVSRFPGVEEAVESGRNAIVVEPGDAAALADRVSQLIANEDLRSELGSNARVQVEQRFAESRMIDQTVQLLQGCADGYEPPPSLGQASRDDRADRFSPP